jgi:hypothetical protein
MMTLPLPACGGKGTLEAGQRAGVRGFAKVILLRALKLRTFRMQEILRGL